MAGSPAHRIIDPFGKLMRKAGVGVAVAGSGPHGNIAVWNSVMDEDRSHAALE
jgi:hypothetical protein